MKRPLLIAYQLLTGSSDTATGLLLIAAPELTLLWMRLQSSTATLPFLSYIGVFVLSVGLACLYGGLLVVKEASAARLEVVWLLTALTRGLVSVFVISEIFTGRLAPGWATVAWTDGILALIQFTGLARGWLRDVCG